MALQTIIYEAKQMIDGLRPFSEFSHLLSQACVIKKENPALNYKIIAKIGRGRYGTLFKVERYSD